LEVIILKIAMISLVIFIYVITFAMMKVASDADDRTEK
jgi:hypothetical protein